MITKITNPTWLTLTNLTNTILSLSSLMAEYNKLPSTVDLFSDKNSRREYCINNRNMAKSIEIIIGQIEALETDLPLDECDGEKISKE